MQIIGIMEKKTNFLSLVLLNLLLPNATVSSEGRENNVDSPTPYGLIDHFAPFVIRHPPADS